MTNAQVAQQFDLLGSLMELHGENPFKIKAYYQAARILKKHPDPVLDLGIEALQEIPGIGKAIAEKIRDLANTGQMRQLEEWKSRTPAGLLDLLEIQGLGLKKLQQLWKELQIESVGELVYACTENRLVSLKGFGTKTQTQLLEQAQYFLSHQHQFRYDQAWYSAEALLMRLRTRYPQAQWEWVGEYRLGLLCLSQLDLLSSLSPSEAAQALQAEGLSLHNDHWKLPDGLPLYLQTCAPEEFAWELLRSTGGLAHWQAQIQALPHDLATESAYFEALGLPFIPPEVRDHPQLSQRWEQIQDLVEAKDIRGLVHIHSRYSDGSNSLKELATAAKAQSFQYLGISDHSRTAVYAGGLSIERVQEQAQEIKSLNAQWTDFKIYQGIESDILPNGDLDYPLEVLQTFDFVIASVHSQLKMTEEQATERLLKAIAHPCTSILGHPTGRLLLSRQGYPLDHRRIIEACAQHGVAIELNANPHRLDLDYTWIGYAMECGVKIAIQPDAHNIRGFEDLRFGLLAARKGFLLRSHLFDLGEYLSQR